MIIQKKKIKIFIRLSILIINNHLKLFKGAKYRKYKHNLQNCYTFINRMLSELFKP